MGIELFSYEAIIPAAVFIVSIIGTGIAIGRKLGIIDQKIIQSHACSKRIEGKIDAHIAETKPLISTFLTYIEKVDTLEDEVGRLRNLNRKDSS